MEYNRFLYVYIDHYKGAKDVEVRFDDRYEIHFDKLTNKLYIKESENHIDNFWGNSIYSFTAIVGENGAGKSTTIKYILEAVASGYHREMDDNIIVMKKGGKLIICTKRIINCEDSAKYEFADYLSIPAFYYSAHFGLPFNGGDMASSQYGKEQYNASDSFRLVRDFRDYCNNNSSDYSQSFYNHLSGYYTQNAFRVCALLGDQYYKMKDFGLHPPRYIHIIPNTSGVSYLQSGRPNKKGNIIIPRSLTKRGTSKRCSTLSWFMHNIVINAIVDVFKFNNNPDTNNLAEEIKNVVGGWTKIVENNTYSDAESLLVEFNKFANSDESKAYIPYDAESMLSFINSNCKFRKNTFYFDMEKTDFEIKHYLNYIEKTGSSIFTTRFFDMAYSHNLDYETILSSGEQAMLDLYSRLYHTLMVNKTGFNNIAEPQLIVLDEAEIGYHPEWQRRFVKNATRFLDSLGMPDEFFQVVVTTHSPLILSDIPLNCTSYLTKEKKDRPKQETFGANIFDLYHNSFFLKEGMIGEFAMEKIENVVRLIDDYKKQGDNVASDEVKKTGQIINLIANDRLRDYLMDELSAIDKEGAIEYYQQKIDNLKQGEHEQN